MRISAKADYALRALIEITAHGDGDPLTAEQIGRMQRIPVNSLRGILTELRQAGLLSGLRGHLGGWRLARRPELVTVADVLRAADGALVSVHELRPEAVFYNETAAILQQVWIATRSSIRDVVENVTLRDLVAGILPDGVSERTQDEESWRSH
jgi:Rrf2 family protein